MRTGALLLAVALLATVTACSSGKDDPETQRLAATDACHDWVKEKLKSPATADFGGDEVTGAGPWTITGWVDSENSFGAKIRTKWECSVRLDGDYFRGRAVEVE